MTRTARTGITSYATPGDVDLVITRVVDAPRTLVFDAWTDPTHIRQWLLGPEGWTMPVCEIDLRPGGAWRYTWRKSDGAEMTLSGSVREFVRPERLVTTESWGPEWPDTLNTLVLTEAGGLTTMTLTVTYVSKEARDAALQTGMKDGIEASYARLDAYVQSLS